MVVAVEPADAVTVHRGEIRYRADDVTFSRLARSRKPDKPVSVFKSARVFVLMDEASNKSSTRDPARY